MKNLLGILLFFSLVACKEDTPSNQLVGTWKLVSYCVPTSSTTCNSVVVPDSKKVFVSFTKNGEFEEGYQNTIPAEYAFLGCGDGFYEILTSQLRIRPVCMSSLNGALFNVVILDNKKLILNGPGGGEYTFEKQ